MTDEELKKYIDEKIQDYCFITCGTICSIIREMQYFEKNNTPLCVDKFWNDCCHRYFMLKYSHK